MIEFIFYLGIKLSDMVLHCTIGGEKCGEENFQLYQDPEFFNCWTFVGNDKKGELEKHEGEEEEQGHGNVDEVEEQHGHEEEEEETEEGGHGHVHRKRRSNTRHMEEEDGAGAGPVHEDEEEDVHGHMEDGEEGEEEEHVPVEDEEGHGHEHEEEEEHTHNLISGPKSGLSLILHAEHVVREIDHYSFEHILINSEGVRVLIREPKTFPTPTQEGFNISPGQSVSVRLKESIRYRLGHPYSSCMPSKEIIPDVKYTVDACYGRCLIDAIEKECSCHTTEGTYILTKEKKHTLHCLSIRDGNITATVSRRLCENSVMANFNYEKDCKQCDWSCIEWDFSPSMSQTDWPPEHTNMDLLDNIVMKQPRGAAYENLKSYLEVNDTTIQTIFEILREKLKRKGEEEEHEHGNKLIII